jgi:hypothetical protein
MSETPKKPVEASPELTRDLNYLLNRQPSGSASPSSERPAEPPDDHADFLATQAGGFAAAKAFAENRRVSQPSPGGSGGETRDDVAEALRRLRQIARHPADQWAVDLLAARLSGDAAPRNEPFTDAEVEALRDALWQASAAWDSCQCFRNECPHEAAYFAARKAFHDATFAGSAPRPQEGEAAALPVEVSDDELRTAMLAYNQWPESARLAYAHPRSLDDVTVIAVRRAVNAVLLARLASPLPPRDERRADPDEDTALIDRLEAIGVESMYLRDGSQFNPGSMSLRAALRLRSARPVRSEEPTDGQGFHCEFCGHEWLGLDGGDGVDGPPARLVCDSCNRPPSDLASRSPHGASPEHTEAES